MASCPGLPYDVFGVSCVLLNSERCVFYEAGIVDEDYVWVNMTVCIVESEYLVVPVMTLCWMIVILFLFMLVLSISE